MIEYVMRMRDSCDSVSTIGHFRSWDEAYDGLEAMKSFYEDEGHRTYQLSDRTGFDAGCSGEQFSYWIETALASYAISWITR